jgi:hypothetical protein
VPQGTASSASMTAAWLRAAAHPARLEPADLPERPLDRAGTPARCGRRRLCRA